MDPTVDLAANSARFLDGLASETALDRDRLDRPGTTVIGREDRAGSGALACYRAGAHLVIWGDPAVVDRVDALAGPDAMTGADLADSVGRAGFALHATVVSNMLASAPPSPSPAPAAYDHVWLDGDEPATLTAVRAFTERCDPDEVEAAALDELDEFDEAAINVLTVEPPEDLLHIVAYASAAAWEWDPTMADIGVLVDAGHRRRGLANLVVANTVARLLADGRLPFYRHAASNAGSASVAASNGFEPVATLDYFTLTDTSGVDD